MAFLGKNLTVVCYSWAEYIHPPNVEYIHPPNVAKDCDIYNY